MKLINFLIAILIFLFPTIIFAWPPITGTIHTIHANSTTRLVHIYLDGLPIIPGTSPCSSSSWTANSMDDIDFKNYILPLLLTAQTTNQQVAISTSGCMSIYPIINYVELVPRE